MRSFLAELYRRDRVLTLAGWTFVALLAAMLVAATADHRQVLGINVWIKPIKFAVSITIYLWTVTWLMVYLPGPGWCKSLIRWGTTAAMLFEIACIAGQSVRGVTSHFNQATPLDTTVFSIMGAFIAFNTALEALLLVLFFRRDIHLPAAYLWGIRLGLAGGLFSAAVGGLIIAQGAHTVGGVDGGAGLWLVNWSTEAGDLRIAHAMGLHALQLLPLAGFGLGRLTSPAASLRWTMAVALAYGAATVWTLWQAIDAQPLLRALADVHRPCAKGLGWVVLTGVFKPLSSGLSPFSGRRAA